MTTPDNPPLTGSGAALALALSELRDKVDDTLACAGGILVRADSPYGPMRQATGAIAQIGRTVAAVGEAMTDDLDREWDTNYAPRLQPRSCVAGVIAAEFPTMHPAQLNPLVDEVLHVLSANGHLTSNDRSEW